MKKAQLPFYILLLSLLFTSPVHADQKPLVDKFLGSPVLVLAAIIIIDIIALVYHRLTRNPW